MKQLRPYQHACHEAVISEYEKGIIRQLIVLFTGAGKTILLIKLLERMGFKRVLWLSFQEDLVVQSAMAFIKEKFDEPFYKHVEEVGFLNYVKDGLFALNDFKLGCIKADIFKPDANVVMGSVMTVARRLDRLPPDYFDCIVCDEAHLFASKLAVQTINHFSPKLLIGCTATPHREDGMLLGDIFDKITFEYGLDKGIKDKWSAELDAIRVTTNVSLDNVKTTAGELNQKDLSNEIDTLARNQLIVDSYKKYCADRQVIAFCVNINHAINLADQFKLNGINAVAVSSDEEKTPNRHLNIQRYKQGKIQVITNVSVLVAGFDHPDTGAVIMASPTKSLTKYLQAVGRTARKKSPEYEAKFGQKALIIDIVDATSRHNLINAWELDKTKPVEERVFVSAEKKEKLLAERAKKAFIEHTRDKDEIVSLLSLPKVKLNKSIRMREGATTAQLMAIKNWGYDVENISYTKGMINEIFMQQSASEKQIYALKKHGYDVSKGVSKAQANLAFAEIENRKK